MVAKAKNIAPAYDISLSRPRLGRGRIAMLVALIVISLITVVSADRTSDSGTLRP